MLGYDDLSGIVKFYRVDKMQKISLTKEKRTGEAEFKGFDMGKFAKSTFGMYGGDIEAVTLQCSNSLIGAILDRFGTDVIIQKVDDEYFRVRVEVAVSGQFFGWLTGLGGGAAIVHPQYVADRMKAHVETVMAAYK